MPVIRSSTTAVAASGLLLEHGGNSKPEAATTVVELLMMGMRMTELCWAAFKRQAINLRNCCIWLVDLFDCNTYFRYLKINSNNTFLTFLTLHSIYYSKLNKFQSFLLLRTCLWLFQYFLGGTEGKYKEPQCGWPVTLPRFEPGICQLQFWNVSATLTHLVVVPGCCGGTR